jgi:hypothetical protein
MNCANSLPCLRTVGVVIPSIVVTYIIPKPLWLGSKCRKRQNSSQYLYGSAVVSIVWICINLRAWRLRTFLRALADVLLMAREGPAEESFGVRLVVGFQVVVEFQEKQATETSQ